MDNFINVEKFEDFLKENLKIYYESSLEIYLTEVETRYGETGSACYELSPFETKSKRPECYYYDVETVEVEEDVFENVFIF